MRPFANAVRLLAVLVMAGQVPLAGAQGLRIGTTLHPYYSFAANIVGDRAEVVPLIDAGSNPHNYTPRADDMRRVLDMDVLIVNGIGHDEWAFEIVRAAGVEGELPLIYANDGVALIPIAADEGDAKVVNPHTFVSTTQSIQQIYTIAQELGELDPDNADFYRDNARAYAARDTPAEGTVHGRAARDRRLRVQVRHHARGLRLPDAGVRPAGHRGHRASAWR